MCEIGVGFSSAALSVFRLRRAEAASAVWIPHSLPDIRSLSNRKGRGRRSGGREREPRRAGEASPKPPPKPRSGLCPELLADFRIPKPPGCSQGAQRAVFCAVRVADFLAQGAGWGAFPGRRGRVGVADSDGARSPSPLPEPSILIHFSSAAVCTLSSWRKLRRPSVFRLVSGAG